jgi:hypothetical protein
MNDYEIVTTSLNNPEWVELLLFSLGRTLSHKGRKIIVYDQGKDPAQVQEVVRNHTGLNVELHHEPYAKGTSYTQGWKRALSFARNEVCFCHADVCFLMKGWDGKLAELREKHSLVATGCGERIKSYMICCRKNLITDTDVGFRTPEGNSRYEHEGIPLQDLADGGNPLLLKYRRTNRRFGDVFFLEGEELLYHNLYSSRMKEDSSCPVPENERNMHAGLVHDNERKAVILREMMEQGTPDWDRAAEILETE